MSTLLLYWDVTESRTATKVSVTKTIELLLGICSVASAIVGIRFGKFTWSGSMGRSHPNAPVLPRWLGVTFFVIAGVWLIVLAFR